MLRLNTFGALWIAGRPAGAGDVRARHLGLLAILAASGARGVSREHVMSILWSESELERARHSLSQALYGLRRELGCDVVLTAPNLRLDSASIASDVGDFNVAVAERDWARAAELYTGPFLDGFYLTDASQFERWVETERSVLLHEALRVLEAEAGGASAAGQREHAVESWRRLTRLDLANGRFALGYIEALVAAGGRTAALQHAESHVELVRRDLGVEPDAAVLAFIGSSRGTGSTIRALVQSEVRSAPSSVASSVASSVTVNREHGRRPLAAWLAVALVVIAGVAALFWRARGTPGGSALVREATRSPVATRIYAEGLRAFYQADAASARELFNAALEEDSNFVMAAYYAWRAEVGIGGPDQEAFAGRAASLAAGASERDRLVVMTSVYVSRWDLRAVAMAESLATRYPNDGEALIGASKAEMDLGRASALLDRAIALDSGAVSRLGSLDACWACEAFSVLVERYEAADSLRLVERTLDRWRSRRPDDYEPSRVRAEYMVAGGNRRGAIAARWLADSLGAPRGDSSERVLERSLRFDDLEAVNAVCRDKLAALDPREFVRFRSLCAIGLRMQGRYRDALALVRTGRAPGAVSARVDVPADSIGAAVLDMEMGRPRAAAFAYSIMAREAARGGLSEGQAARGLAWALTLEATALAVAGDTIPVRALADSVALAGQRSLDARDSRLHHYLRGVLLAKSGEHEQAVREFRAAISSPTRGFTKINYEMAKSLLALNRSAEAIPVLRSALRGRLDESSIHVTRTELHEILARSFLSASMPDSAAFHYAAVERAWRAADPILRERHDAARRAAARSYARMR